LKLKIYFCESKTDIYKSADLLFLRFSKLNMKFQKNITLFIAILLVSCTSSNYTKTANTDKSSVGISTEMRADAEAVATILPYKAKLDAEMNEVIAEASMDLIKPFNGKESNLGNFSTNLILVEARKYFPTDFAVLTIGGLRVSLDKGDVTLRKVYELMPFDNELVVLGVKGDIAERLIMRLVEKNNTSLAGVEAKFAGKKLISAKINGEPFDKNKVYWLATTDYLANGGDYMGFLKEVTEKKSTGIKIRDSMIQHFRDLTEAGKKANAETGKLYEFGK
jgi:2',3'-cyclic-nucleotide 2'-phosphodiesterase (5'-nucleotidase family)